MLGLDTPTFPKAPTQDVQRETFANPSSDWYGSVNLDILGGKSDALCVRFRSQAAFRRRD